MSLPEPAFTRAQILQESVNTTEWLRSDTEKLQELLQSISSDESVMYCPTCFQPIIYAPAHSCLQGLDLEKYPDLLLDGEKVKLQLEELIDSQLSLIQKIDQRLPRIRKGDRKKMNQQQKPAAKPSLAKAAKPAPAPEAVAAQEEAKARQPRKKVTGQITVVFTDQEFSFAQPREARRWLRDLELSVKNASKDEKDPHIWYFDMKAPADATAAPKEKEEGAEEEDDND